MTDRIDPRPGEVLLDPACGTGGFLTSAIRQMRQRYVKTVGEEQRMQQGLRAVEKKQLVNFDDLLDAQVRKLNPKYARRPGRADRRPAPASRGHRRQP